MQPEININYLAIMACVVAAVPIGFLWFGPLFGKAWAKRMAWRTWNSQQAARWRSQ